MDRMDVLLLKSWKWLKKATGWGTPMEEKDVDNRSSGCHHEEQRHSGMMAGTSFLKCEVNQSLSMVGVHWQHAMIR